MTKRPVPSQSGHGEKVAGAAGAVDFAAPARLLPTGEQAAVILDCLFMLHIRMAVGVGLDPTGSGLDTVPAL
jgi:hypothetical protein